MGATLTRLPPPIGPYVARYVSLRRRQALVRAVGLATVFALTWGLGCCLIDRVVPLAAAARLALLATALTAVVVVIAHPLILWLSRAVDWRAAAAHIEQRDERLAQRLQTVTSELLDARASRAGSREIVDELSRQVGEVLTTSAPQSLSPWRPALSPWLAAFVLVGGGAALARLPTLGLPQLASRFVMPMHGIPPVTTTRLTLTPLTASVVEGQPVRITLSAKRLARGKGVTLYHGAAGSVAWASTVMTPKADGAFDVVIPSVTQDFRYFARGGDARSATGSVRVLRKPTLTELRVRYTYPPYTNRPPLTVANTDGLVEAPTGTKAALTFVSAQPLAAAGLVIDGDQTLNTIPGDSLRERRATLTVTKDQAYSLSLVSVDQVTGGGPGTMMIRAIPDRPPLVQVHQPPGELRLSPRDILSLPFQALDDYGVASLTTNVQITASGVDASGEPINLAQAKPATQPSTWGGAGADRAVDGKTDGDYAAASVSHTDLLPHAWWQVDLGNVTPVAVIEVWNRTDAQPQRLSDFYVFVSDAPFLSDDPAAIAAQAGVSAFRVTEQAQSPSRIEIFRTARFVRVQLARAAPEYLSLAEVRVLQAKPLAAGALASRSFDANLPVSGDPRQQEGEAVLDLARIKVGVGDVVNVSVTVTDTGNHVTVAGPIRVVVSPRAIDQRTYDRITELGRAVELSSLIVAQLDTATASFDPAAARGVSRIEAYLSALAAATRELSGISETSAALQSAMLRCIIRSDGPALSVALAAMVDELQQLAAASAALSAAFAFDAAPSDADRAALAAALTTARRITGHLTDILRGEKAGAILADLDNLLASEAGMPTAKEAADRARERARRVREDVAAATKELGFAAGGPETALQLKELVGARQSAMRSYAIADYAAPAQAYAAAMAGRLPLPPLVPRLSAAAQAEAIRPDGDLVRARDLQLAASAALRVRDANAVTRDEFAVSFAQTIAALQRQHAITGGSTPTTAPTVTAEPATAATTRPTTSPATVPASVATTMTTTMPGTAIAVSGPTATDATRIDAEDARRRLSLWARGENEQSASEAAALARAQELAMEANADLSQRKYESAEQADERIVSELRLAERTFPRAAARFEQARDDVRRSTEKAQLLDRLSAKQQRLISRATELDAAGLETAQEELGLELAEAGIGENDGTIAARDSSDTRSAAVAAIRRVQERLAAMPQQLRSVESALGERSAAAARLRQARQQLMPPEEQGVATRAVRGAEEQLREAEQQLAARLQPLGDVVAVELSRSLASYAPETTDAVRGVLDRLGPAMSQLQRAASAGTDDTARALAELRGAMDAVQTRLKDAQAALLERDPLTAARVYARAAASSLLGKPPDVAAAVAHQQNASTALARAWDATIHEAAAARLAGLPTLRPLFTPRPDASAAPTQGAAENVASKLPMFFEWGRLPWRAASSVHASPRATDAQGYQESLQAYFEALGVTQPVPEPKQ